MCYFLNFALPAQDAQQIAKAFGRGYQVFPGSKGLGYKNIPQDYEAFVVTRGMCSCDMYTSPEIAKEAREGSIVKPKRKKLRQQGWSETKQRRAREQSEKHDEKKLQQLVGSFTGLAPEVTRCIETLCQATKSVYLMVHWNDREEAESPSAKPLRTCILEQFPEVAKTISVDELLHVHP